jgi:predicted phage gp36 major capsid-like protein
LKLRGEFRDLRQTKIENARLETANARLRAEENRVAQQLAEARAAPNYWPKEQLAPAGYAEPAAAMKSLLAAMSRGEVNSWRESCAPEALAKMEDMWARRGLSESQREDEIKAMASALVSLSEGFHVIDQTAISPDETMINLSFDGEGKARKFVLRKTGNEWKFEDLLVAGQ